jgi:class 3 adenylate cyclase
VRVGRDEEVARLAEWAQTRAMTLIAGEAGVGKSRLASEAVRIADELGLSRLIGHCTSGTSLPYAPFVTALRRRTRTLDAETLRGLFDGPALLAAALLPEVAAGVGLPKDVPEPEHLFAAVWQLLKRLEGPSGCLLLLEDLHWADTDSLRLLSYLARERSDLDVWLVGTYRSDELHRRHPLTLTLAELARGRAYEEVQLSPLNGEELGEMVSAIFDGAKVSEQFVEALLRRTGGNPFFVEELIKALVDRGDIYRESGDWARRDMADIEMPVTVREALLSRALTMGDTSLEILQLAALAGEQLDIAALALAAGTSSERIDAVVREALRLQLLVERRDGPRTVYLFRHALTREAIADEVVGPDRQRMHLTLARAITAAHEAGLDQFAADLADHFGQAGDAPRAVEFGTRAARLAAASYAFDEAGRRYESVLRLLPEQRDERLPLLLEAAAALTDAPDRRLAVAFAIEARDLAHSRSDRLSEGRALYVLQRCAWQAGDTQRALLLTREALERVRGLDDVFEALILARLTRVLTFVDRRREAEELLQVGIPLAIRAGNFTALSLMHGTRMLNERPGAAFEEAFDAALLAARDGQDEESERNLTTNAGYICLWSGEFGRARESLVRAMDLNERFAPHDRYTHAGYAWLLSLCGDYQEALSRSEPLRGVPSIPTRIVALTARYEVAERRGEQEAAAIADELLAVAQRTGESQRRVPALAAQARHLLRQGGIASAAPIFWDVMKVTSAEKRTGSHWLFSPDFSSALAEEEQVSELARWVGAVESLTEADPNRHNRAAYALCQAHLLSARGSLASAERSFEHAAEMFREMGCPAREAEVLIGLAGVELRLEHGEASAATARNALAIAERIGAHDHVQRATRAMERAESPPILATVLFTDIVRSTERISEIGDRAWRSLLDRHNSLVRKELVRWSGREIDTTGDGFLATFESPVQAIRCAISVRDALSVAGIQIRAGLHTGECIVMGNDLAGLAVHIAARVSAIAGPGEVLVSGTVRDLVAGSTFSFVDRGVHQLKGVPGSWQLLAVSR